MRRIVARVPSDSYAAGGKLRLYGPDETGALVTATPSPAGLATIAPTRREPDGWGEVSLGAFALGGTPRERARFGAHGLATGFAPLAPVVMQGASHEYGVFEYGAKAEDFGGATSGAPVAGSLLVVAAPEAPQDATLAVAGGVLSMTIVSR